MSAFLKRWGPALLVMAAIFTASSIPGKDLPQLGLLDLSLKKGGHVLGYLLLGFFLLRGLVPSGSAPWRAAGLAVLLAGLYAVSDEVHQSFVPGRRPAVADLAIDLTGAALGAGLRRLLDGRGRAPGPLAA